MMIIEHGQWEVYEPASPILIPGQTVSGPGAPKLLYSRRVDTQEDWYTYLHMFDNSDSVVMTVLHLPSNVYIIQVATRDAQTIFPYNGRLIEVDDYVGSDPQAYFGQRTYDPNTNTIGDVYVYPTPPDANVRLDAGINAVVTIAAQVRDNVEALPAGFSPSAYADLLVQLKVLTAAFAAMLEAQQNT